MSKEDAQVGVVPPTYDSEKGARHTAGDGHVPENFREDDFMTRNGLNLKSFQRRECIPLYTTPLGLLCGPSPTAQHVLALHRCLSVDGSLTRHR